MWVPAAGVPELAGVVEEEEEEEEEEGVQPPRQVPLLAGDKK